MSIGAIIGLIIAVGAVVVLGLVIRSIVIKINQSISKASNLIGQIQRATEEAEHTPKSLSGSESLHRQKLMKDFPEFDFDAAKQIISGVLSGYFTILSERSGTDRIEKNCTPAFITELESKIISENKVYSNFKIHRIVVSDYRKNHDEAILTYQAALQYQFSGKAVTQWVYEIKYVYYLAEGGDNENASLTFEYCGAPISSVGNKVCEFCGSEIHASVERTWKINKISKLR